MSLLVYGHVARYAAATKAALVVAVPRLSRLDVLRRQVTIKAKQRNRLETESELRY